MYERRSIQRTKVLKNAEIVFGASGRVHCTLLDLSDHGACLSVASTSTLPDTFDLTFDRGLSHRPCRVAWRTEARIGVAFVRDGAGDGGADDAQGERRAAGGRG
jgi:hypothetical protein